MQQAWLDLDVAQCGYCQPGQIMTAVALVEELRAKGKPITDAEPDQIFATSAGAGLLRIREAIVAGASAMKTPAHPGHHRHHHAPEPRGTRQHPDGSGPSTRRAEAPPRWPRRSGPRR